MSGPHRNYFRVENSLRGRVLCVTTSARSNNNRMLQSLSIIIMQMQRGMRQPAVDNCHPTVWAESSTRCILVPDGHRCLLTNNLLCRSHYCLNKRRFPGLRLESSPFKEISLSLLFTCLLRKYVKRPCATPSVRDQVLLLASASSQVYLQR